MKLLAINTFTHALNSDSGILARSVKSSGERQHYANDCGYAFIWAFRGYWDTGLSKVIFWSVIVQFLDVLFRDINEVYTLHSEPPANELALRSSTSRMKPNPTSITSRLLTL
jgi:hypothetical protein